MDELELSVTRTSSEDSPLFTEEWRVRIYVNGRSLIDLANEATKPKPPLERTVSSFIWMEQRVIAPPALHLLGRPGDGADESFEGRPYLLACNCGFAACGGIFASIVLNPSDVDWLGFGRAPDGRILAGFGPYRFPRPDYERAVRSIASTQEGSGS